MKILAVVNCPGDKTDHIELMPDSSVIKDGRPFFVPAIAGSWDYYIGVAYQVTRMGKCVAEKFAPRYVGAITLCVMPRPSNVDKRFASGGELLHAFDGAAIIGSWTEITDAPQSLSVRFNDREVKFCTDPSRSIAPMVSQVSHFGTLKTGDVLIPAVAYVGADFAEDTVCRATLNDVECLKFKVK